MKKIITYILVATLFTNCIKDEFGLPEIECSDDVTATKTLDDIHQIATETPFLYQNDDILEAYVVSSDQSGNFFKTLSLQNKEGTIGINIPVDYSDLYTIYNVGRKVYIKLKDKYIVKDDNGILSIGNLENDEIRRITSTEYKQVLVKSCEVITENELVTKLNIEDINDSHINTLVELQNVQFKNDALGKKYFETSNSIGGSTNHTIIDETGANIFVRTSRYADFAQVKVPEGNGTIKGIITKFGDDYQLLPRTLLDINMNNDRLDIVINLKNNVFITEIADPDNNSGARFIEIYNGDDADISLNGWKLNRYTNANTSVSSSIDLTGFTIKQGETFVIAANAATFKSVYGFDADLEGGSGSPADSNGDDNFELIDSQGTIVDVFGVIGVDGTGTNHEFEDGRALRNASVTTGNTTYTFSEWQIWNDSGNSGTTNLPQNAPSDFTPGSR